MEVGEVRIADDKDFEKFFILAESVKGWTIKYHNMKTGIKVWVQNPDEVSNNISTRMLKAFICMEDVPASICYDVLHDPEFRKEWDSTMLEGKEVYMLNPNNDISYYAAKCPSPLKNRDFLLQRTWLETPSQYIIFNHSIFHKDYPPKKGLIRGESHLTGYLVKPKTKTSCELTYVTQTDPKGTVPKWAVNKVAEMVAPTLLRKLHKACQRYPGWKSVNNPNHKPWIYPEQMNLPRLNMNDVMSKNNSNSEESLEDGELKEEDFKGGSLPPPTPEPKVKLNGDGQENKKHIDVRANGLSSSSETIASSITIKSTSTVINDLPPPPLDLIQATGSFGTEGDKQTRTLSDSSSIHSHTDSDKGSSTAPTPASHEHMYGHSSPPSPSFSNSSGTQSEFLAPSHKNDPKSNLLKQNHGPYPKHGQIYKSEPAVNRLDSPVPEHYQYQSTKAGSHPMVGYPAPMVGSHQHLNMVGHQSASSQTSKSSSGPFKFLKKKPPKKPLQATLVNVHEFNDVEYDQLKREFLIREHKARMFVIQEELDMKRQEHQARMEMISEIRKGIAGLPVDKQLLLQKTSSIVTNEMIVSHHNK